MTELAKGTKQYSKPEFGIKRYDLQFTFSHKIFEFNDSVREIIRLGKTVVNRMRQSNVMNGQTTLLRGDLGKSALAPSKFSVYSCNISR